MSRPEYPPIELDDCRLLWAAVMIENIQCAYDPNRTKNIREQQSAISWLRSRDFDMICGWFGFDANDCRRRLDSLPADFKWTNLSVQSFIGASH